MTTENATATWRWVVGLMFGVIVTGGGWLYSGLQSKADDALTKADQAVDYSQENAVAIRGLVEVIKGDHKVRDELIKRFEALGQGYAEDLGDIKEMQRESAEEIRNLDRRLTRIEAQTAR